VFREPCSKRHEPGPLLHLTLSYG